MGSLTLRVEYTLRVLNLFTACIVDQYTHLLQPTKCTISYTYISTYISCGTLYVLWNLKILFYQL